RCPRAWLDLLPPDPPANGKICHPHLAWQLPRRGLGLNTCLGRPSASPFSPASSYGPRLPREGGGTQSQCPRAHVLQGAEERPNTMQRSEWSGLPSQWAFSAGTPGWIFYVCHSLLTQAGVVVSGQDIFPDQWEELQLLCMQLDQRVNTHIQESPQAMHQTKLEDMAPQTYIHWQELLAHCEAQALEGHLKEQGRAGLAQGSWLWQEVNRAQGTGASEERRPEKDQSNEARACCTRPPAPPGLPCLACPSALLPSQPSLLSPQPLPAELWFPWPSWVLPNLSPPHPPSSVLLGISLCTFTSYFSISDLQDVFQALF
ncbi:hypothetical protein MC885_012003, partial [Smutsia gigantea]